MGSSDKHPLVQRLAVTQRSRLQRFLRRRARNVADIPDLMQEVYLRLLRVPNHETIRVPERYIFTIARHVVSQHNLRASDSEEVATLDDAGSDSTSVAEFDPLLEVTAQQCLSVVDDAVRAMPPKMQATFLLSRRDGLSVDEICARLGISRPMAKKYMVGALVLCRKRLKAAE